MLEGFVIKGNELDQPPSKATEVCTNAPQRNYTSIVISVFIHLLLACLLVFIAEKEQIKPEKNVKKAIKSYLYQRPAKKVELKPVTQELKVEGNRGAPKQNPPSEVEIIKEENKSLVKRKETNTSITKVGPNLKSKIQKPIKASVSAYKQLNNLRNTINAKAISQELAELQQFRSPSVMHGTQTAVPHSFVKLTPEQDRHKSTTKMSNDISITKNEDGSCTIDRAQFLGSPVEGSSSSFACGESKFDKSFREHMKKVQEKLMPQR